MAKAISDEELQLKKRARRRLVGAVALVLLIVVFLPMVLDSEPKPLNQDVSISIPPIPKTESSSQLPAPPPAQPPASSTSAPSPHVAGLPEGPPSGPSTSLPAGEPRSEAAPDPAKPEVSAKAKPEPRPAAKPFVKREPKPAQVAAAAPAGEDSFVVQLGAFSNSANAKSLQKKLQDNKFKAYTELVRNAGGDRTRVRVGPYASREAAEKARERLKSMKLIIGDAAVVRRD